MNLHKKHALTGLAVAGLMFFAVAASADDFEETRMKKEIDACITELAGHVDYDDASLVRHSIVVTKRRAVGHKLSIETSVYAGDSSTAIRGYESSCVVYGDRKPVRFSVTETDAGA